MTHARLSSRNDCQHDATKHTPEAAKQRQPAAAGIFFKASPIGSSLCVTARVPGRRNPSSGLIEFFNSPRGWVWMAHYQIWAAKLIPFFPFPELNLVTTQATLKSLGNRTDRQPKRPRPRTGASYGLPLKWSFDGGVIWAKDAKL